MTDPTASTSRCPTPSETRGSRQAEYFRPASSAANPLAMPYPAAARTSTNASATAASCATSARFGAKF